MSLTYIKARITNPANPRKSADLEFLVDSGAEYSVVPTGVLKRLGIKPRTKRTFILADGSTVERKMGHALFRLNGNEGASPLILGQKDDSTLLGVVSLEALGLILDPLKRELRSLPMVLGASPRPDVQHAKNQNVFVPNTVDDDVLTHRKAPQAMAEVSSRRRPNARMAARVVQLGDSLVAAGNSLSAARSRLDWSSPISRFP